LGIVGVGVRSGGQAARTYLIPSIIVCSSFVGPCALLVSSAPPFLRAVEPAPPSCQGFFVRAPWVRGVLAALLLLPLVISVAVAVPLDADWPPAPYSEQRLDWQPCRPDLPALLCAAMTVPVDWDRPAAGGDLKVMVSRIPARDPARRRGALFTNPGGPGQPGRLYPLLWYLFKPDIAAVYDVVGMDPRGSGLSSPIACNPERPDLPGDLRVRSPATLDALRSRALVGAAACVDPARGLARYMNTHETVRDMDLLRALLEEPTISYVGASAGSWLGAWYASEFPQRVDRFVFDSVVDVTGSWYDWQVAMPAAVQRSFEADFLPWLARYDAIYHYGATAQQAAATWEARRSALAGSPLVLSPACTVRPTEFEQLTWTGIVGGPRGGDGFVGLARTLSILERLGSASPDELRDLEGHVVCMASPDPIAGAAGPLALESILCGDTASPAYAQYEQDSVRLGRRYPLFGWWHEVRNGYCAFWPFPPTGPPRIDGQELPPMLMVNTEHDPITPLEGVLGAARRFPSARLLVVRNESQHIIYGQGNACVDGYVDGFLLTGALPAPRATCDGVPLPVPPDAVAPAP
jgi:pimeloyl-ACP methyl ester carboxylesterase